MREIIFRGKQYTPMDLVINGLEELGVVLT